MVTPYYLRNQKVIETKEKIILDAGCGSGYTSLVLAEANPGLVERWIKLKPLDSATLEPVDREKAFYTVQLLLLDLANLGYLMLES